MASPQLRLLRQRDDWAPAVRYFRTRLRKIGRKTIDGKVVAFRQAYAGNPAAALVDAVLSVQNTYERIVAPSVQQWMESHPNASFATLIPSGGAPVGSKKDWPVERYAAIAQVAKVLGNYDSANVISDEYRLSAWARDAEYTRFRHETDPVGRIRNVGIAVFQYLRMRGGADAIKPDLRVIARFEDSGFKLPSQGYPHRERVVLYVAEAMAEELRVGRLWFDKLLW